MLKSLLSVMVVVFLFLCGCAKEQTATYQIMQLTDNPVIIAKAGYVDALVLYRDVQKAYKPHVQIVKEFYPEVHETIVANMKNAWRILQKWKTQQDIAEELKSDFRVYIRAIAIDIIRAAEEK